MMPPDAPHLDGTIALDAFAGRALAFSYAGKTLDVLAPKELRRAARGKTAVPLHIVRDAEGLALTVNLPVETSAGNAWFEVDAGNVSPFLLFGEHLAALMRLKQATRDTQKLHARLRDGTSVDGDAKVLDLTLDGNLGTSFLEHYDVLLNLTEAKAWLIPRYVAAHAKLASLLPLPLWQLT